MKECQELREKNQPTIPSTIGEELTYNPFMRTHVKSVMEKVGKTDPVEVMHALRTMKNNFK